MFKEGSFKFDVPVKAISAAIAIAREILIFSKNQMMALNKRNKLHMVTLYAKNQ